MMETFEFEAIHKNGMIKIPYESKTTKNRVVIHKRAWRDEGQFGTSEQPIRLQSVGMGVGPQQHIEIIYKTLKSCVKQGLK